MTTTTTTPHDALFKLVFSQPEHAEGELRSVLPPDLVRRIDWSTLTLCPGSFVDEALAQSHADLLFSALLDGEPTFLYVLFEHQSTEVVLMPLRLLRYEVDIWDDWLAAHPDAKKLPPILPVVLHHSELGWRVATAFEDILAISADAFAAVAPFVPRFRFILDDVSKIDDDALRRRAMTALGKLALWCFRDVRKPGELVRNLARFKDLLEEVLTAPSGLKAVSAVLIYILSASGRLPKEEVERIVRLATSQSIEGMMGSLAEQIEEIGIEKGVKKGLEEGIAAGERLVLRRQLQRRFGVLPAEVTARIEQAGRAELEGWSDNVLTAASLAEVFGAAQ